MADGKVKIQTELDNSGFESGLDKMKSSASKGSEIIKGAFTALGVGIGVMATAIGTAGFKFNSQMENYKAGFTALLGSADKANQMVKDLQNMAAKTPFELTDLAKASQTLLAFGADAKTLIPTLQNIGDVSMGNKERFQALALAFGQVQAAGKMTGQDLLQMINAGFNPLQEISAKTGKSMAQLKDEMSDGAISAEMVADAFKSATSEGGRFNNAMEIQSRTLEGQFSTLKDNFNSLSGQILQPLYSLIRDKVIPVASDFISKISYGLKTGNWYEFNGIIQGLGSIIDVVSKSFEFFYERILIPLGDTLNPLLKQIQDFISKVGYGLRTGDWGEFTGIIKSINTWFAKTYEELSTFLSKVSFGLKTGDWKEFNDLVKTITVSLAGAGAALLGFKAGVAIQGVIVAFQTASLQIGLYTAGMTKAIIENGLYATSNISLAVAQGLVNGQLTIMQGLVALLTGKINLADLATALWTKTTGALNAMWAANPIGLVVAAIAALVAIILTVNALMDKSKETATNMSEGFKQFQTEVLGAKSNLEQFASVFQMYDEKGAEIQKSIAEVQKGITDITTLATQERRALTDSEIQKLDEYFNKLHELQDQEMKLQEAKSQAIQIQAQNMLNTMDLTAEQYKIKGAEWLKTQDDINTQTLQKIEEQRITETALLNQKYGDQANLQNSAYVTELNNLNKRFDDEKTQTESKMGELWATYSQGYAKRLGLDDEYNKKVMVKLQDRAGNFVYQNASIESEMKRHTDTLSQIDKDYVDGSAKKNQAIENETAKHKSNIGSIWAELVKGMDENKQKQLANLIGMVSNTELYGGQLDTKTKETADGVISSFEKMPKKSQGIMKDTLEPMLTEMENKKPSLFQKAKEIADGIVSKLKTWLKISSPSKVTRDIFRNVMKGMIVGMDNEKNSVYSKVDSIFGRLKSAMDLEGMGIAANLQTGNIYNRAYNTIPVNVNGTYTSNIEVDGEVLATTVNRIDQRRNLQYGY